jgi:DNA-binding response OmpR family regulator
MSGTETPTILVVDDESDVADAYAAQLESKYDVSTAYGGEDALDRLNGSIDAVLLDRRMPGLSGDEVLEEIRDQGIDCRVAMVTAVDPDFDIIEMPFDEYVIKPVSRDELLGTIEQLLTRSEYEDQIQEYYALAAKHATLRANKPETALTSSDEFGQLEARMNELRSDLDETLSEFDDEDFTAVFRDLGAGSTLESTEE